MLGHKQQPRFVECKELRPVQHQIYRAVDGLEWQGIPVLRGAGILYSPSGNRSVVIRKPQVMFPTTWLILSSVPDETPPNQWTSIKNEGLLLGVSGGALILAGLGVAGAVAAGPALLTIAVLGAVIASAQFGVQTAKLELAGKDFAGYNRITDPENQAEQFLENSLDVAGLSLGFGGAARSVATSAAAFSKSKAGITAGLHGLMDNGRKANLNKILNGLTEGQKDHLERVMRELYASKKISLSASRFEQALKQMRHAGHIGGALKIHISPELLNNLIQRQLLKEFHGAAKAIGSTGNVTGVLGSSVSGYFSWLSNHSSAPSSARNIAYAQNRVILFTHARGQVALTWSIYQANIPVQ